MKNIIFILVIAHNISFIISFNISPIPNFVYNKPFFERTDSRDRSSYFGFSLLLQQKSLLVGAPRANSTLKEQSSIIEPGLLYKCSVFNNDNSTCELLIVEEKANIFNGLDENTEIRDRQWLGASISGDKIKTTDKPSLIVCAPFISTRFSRIPFGACYFLKNKKNTIKIVKPLIPDTRNPIFASILGLSNFWIPNKNSVLLGTPGRNVDGGFLFYNTENKSGEVNTNLVLDDGYTGYSVSAGIIAKKKGVFYVIGAPRYSYFGAVKIVNDGFSHTKLLMGSQLYEYFGYSILTEDLNGDDFPEIVVSAPYYTENNYFEIGAIYVHYGNEYKNLSTPSIICPSKISRARFGLSLALLGDINLDGYNDIAVGAPNEENGRVYIFGGSDQGLIAKPVQILEAPSFSNLLQPYNFGYSISSGVDIDGNGVNDIAISAINIDKVFLFKTYPIINVEIYFKNFPPYIMFTDKSFEFETCIRFESLKFLFKNHLTFRLSLKSGRMENRIKFDKELYEKNFEVRVKHNNTVCPKHFVYITHNNETKPIEIELSYEHIQKNFTAFFCEECIKINTNNMNKIFQTFYIQHKCNNTMCRSDLQIKILSLKKKYLILDENKLLNISLEIKNYNDTAYLPGIAIKNNHNLPLVQAPSTCFIQSSVLVCNLWNNQIFVLKDGEIKILKFSYDISNLEGPNLKIETEIYSMSEELNKTDNFDSLTLRLLECRGAEVVEISDTTSQTLNMYENKLNDTVIEKVFKVTNFASTSMKNVILTFRYPIINNEIASPIIEEMEEFYINDKRLLLMMVDDNILHYKNSSRQVLYKNSSTTISLDFNAKINNSFNLLELCNFQYQISDDRQFLENSRTQLINNITLDFKMVFDSEKLTKTAIKKVETKSFKIEKLDAGPENSIKVIIRLKVREKDVFQLLQENNKNYLVYNMNIMLRSEDCSDNANCTPSIEISRSRMYEILIIRILNNKLSFWIYVSSFVLGILIYIIIVIFLYKVGFFKRFRQEQVKNELKLEKQKSQISIISPDAKKD